MAKQQILRDLLIKKATLFLISGMVGLAGVFYLTYLKNDAEDNLNRLRIETNGLNAKLEELTRKTREINEAMKLWQKLNIKQKKREGLKIDTAQQLLDDLKSRFRLASLEINLSSPTELVDVYKTDTVAVISSDLTLRATAATDVQLLSFIEAFTKELPGYIKLKSVTLRRNADFTNDILVKIGKGEKVDLVSADIVLLWRDLKDIPAKK